MKKAETGVGVEEEEEEEESTPVDEGGAPREGAPAMPDAAGAKIDGDKATSVATVGLLHPVRVSDHTNNSVQQQQQQQLRARQGTPRVVVRRSKTGHTEAEAEAEADEDVATTPVRVRLG